MNKIPPCVRDAITRATGDIVGAAVTTLQFVDPSNPYTLMDYALKELKKATDEAFPNHRPESPMTDDDFRKDIICTCEFVVKILKS